MKHTPYEYVTTLARLCDMPRRIISHQDHDHLAALVLCDVCQPWCCNISRAAYLVNNPDFSCCRGVAGYASSDIQSANVWDVPEDVAQQYEQSDFHTTVRHLTISYLESGFTSEIIQRMAEELGIENPQIKEWEGRYGNRGILLFETNQPLNAQVEQHMDAIGALLSLCPSL